MKVELRVAQGSPTLGSAGSGLGSTLPKGFSNPNNSIISTSKVLGQPEGTSPVSHSWENTSATAATGPQEIDSELGLKVYELC